MLLAQRKLMALFAKDVKITATAWWGFLSFAIMDQYWTNQTTSNRSIEVRESGADFVRSPLYLVNYITVVSWRRSLCWWWWWRWWCWADWRLIPILFPLAIRNLLVHVKYAPRNESVGLISSYLLFVIWYSWKDHEKDSRIWYVITWNVKSNTLWWPHTLKSWSKVGNRDSICSSIKRNGNCSSVSLMFL